MIRQEAFGEIRGVGMAARPVSDFHQDLDRLEARAAVRVAVSQASIEIDAMGLIGMAAVHAHAAVIVLHRRCNRAHGLRHWQESQRQQQVEDQYLVSHDVANGPVIRE